MNATENLVAIASFVEFSSDLSDLTGVGGIIGKPAVGYFSQALAFVVMLLSVVNRGASLSI